MSRSFKKNPTSQMKEPKGKRKASRKVRHTPDVPLCDGGYKKVVGPYDVCDGKYTPPLKELKDMREEEPREYYKIVGK